MADDFQYDVFLSHNARDKPRVRRLAERLKQAGLRVWFDDWNVKPGDDIYLSIERGLEEARVLLLCISPHALASGWVALERSTAIHRDPANTGRRFIPLLLADCELPDTLRRYKYVDFREEAEAAFAELLNVCLDETATRTRRFGLPQQSRRTNIRSRARLSNVPNRAPFRTLTTMHDTLFSKLLSGESASTSREERT